jgi:hypothetical protein
MNGKPGDHPITDLMVHHIAVFGEPLDIQLRQLGELMSYKGLVNGFSSIGLCLRKSFSPSSRRSLRSCDATRGSEAGKTFHDTQPVATSSV